MKNMIICVAISLIFLGCQNHNGNLNPRNKVSVAEMNFHFVFKKLDTLEAVKCFGQTLTNNLSSYSLSQLSDIYIVEIQNLGLDSISIPCKYLRGLPIYYSGETKYYRTINDTIPLSVALPFESPPTNQEKLLKNEKKCFLTTLMLNKEIAKIEYLFYSYINNEMRPIQCKVVLTKPNNEFIDMTKY
jgi:hypothetical protein